MKNLLVAKFVLPSKLPRALWALERPLSRVQHFVPGHVLRPRELLAADVARVIIMFFGCPITMGSRNHYSF